MTASSLVYVHVVSCVGDEHVFVTHVDKYFFSSGSYEALDTKDLCLDHEGFLTAARSLLRSY